MAESDKGREPSSLGQSARIHFLAKDAIVYGGAATLSRALSLITFPILARSFTVDEYGLIEIFTVVTNMIALLIVFGQDSAVARYYYERTDDQYRKSIISQSLAFQVALALVVVPVLFMTSDSVAARLHQAPEASAALKLVLLQVPALVITNFSLNLLKWTFQRWQFLVLSLGGVALNLLLLIVCVIVFDANVASVFAAALGCQVLLAALGLIYVRRWIVWPRLDSHFGPLLRYAAPLGVVAGLGAAMPVVERFIVNGQFGPTDLGLYAVAVRIAGFLTLVVQAFQMAWGPFSLSIHKEENASDAYDLVLTWFTLGIVTLALVAGAFASPLIALLASNRYVAAAGLVLPLAMALAIQSVGWITELGVGLAKKSHFQLICYALYAAVTLFGIYLLASPFGLMGVAYAVLAGQMAKVAVLTRVSMAVYPISWDLISPAVIAILGLLAGVLMQWGVGDVTTWKNACLHGVSIAAYLVLTLFLVIGRKQRRALLTLVLRK